MVRIVSQSVPCIVELFSKREEGRSGRTTAAQVLDVIRGTVGHPADSFSCRAVLASGDS